MAESASMTQKVEDAQCELSALSEQLAEGAAAIAEKETLIKQLEDQRQAAEDDQAHRVQEMKTAVRTMMSENKELKKRLAALGKDQGAGATSAAAALSDAERRVAALTQRVEQNAAVIAQKDARIKRLEEVRLTTDQVEKLRVMKMGGIAAAAENKELKKRLAALEGGGSSGGAGTTAGADSASASAAAAAAAAAAAGAEERVAELLGVKEALLKKVREYGTRIHEIEKERARVRAAVEEAGVSAPKGRDLSEAVLEVVERAAGGDMSFMSNATDGDGAAVTAALAAAERHRSELQEARETLRRAETERLTLQEQMRAGVAKFRALEAQEVAGRERLEEQMARNETIEQEAKALKEAIDKEKDHARNVKFLEVGFG